MEKLESKNLEDILAYLYSIDDWVSTSSLRTNFSYGKPTTLKYLNLLLEKEYIQRRFEGRLLSYGISELGKKYVKEQNLTVLPKLKLEEDKKIKESLYILNEKLEEIEYLKERIDKQEQVVDKKNNEIDSKLQDLNRKIKKVENMTENFYGKIGEIITLLIASISIIVFNIKVMDSTKIDFINGYKQAFLNIMAIDLPLIVLLVVATVLFHYIVGKELKLKNLIIVVVIIIACMGILLI